MKDSAPYRALLESEDQYPSSGPAPYIPLSSGPCAGLTREGFCNGCGVLEVDPDDPTKCRCVCAESDGGSCPTRHSGRGRMKGRLLRYEYDDHCMVVLPEFSSNWGE